MKSIPITAEFDAVVTQMRDGAAYGATAEELVDGNMIPRLCQFAGEQACAQTCQLRAENVEDPSGKLCASENILTSLRTSYISPENFAMVAATQDRVLFGDTMDDNGATRHEDGYSLVPNCNAFFFRPGKDKTHNGHRNLNNVAMRMADCGDVIYNFNDEQGEEVVGIAHFSRTNMRGPSAFVHELGDKKVSWGEYVLANAVEHYGADPASMKIRLVAAVEGENFVHHYADRNGMEAHYPGWDELGFMHPSSDTDFDCLIDYREMIQWQLTDGISNPSLRVPMENITLEGAIDTGDLTQGHASHHAASHGDIAHGRDMYMVGLNKRAGIAARINELEKLQNGRNWTMDTFGEMSDVDYNTFSDLVRVGEKELGMLRQAAEALSLDT